MSRRYGSSKRNFHRKGRTHRTAFRRPHLRPAPQAAPLPFEDEVLGRLYETGEWTDAKELAAGMDLSRQRRKELQQVLKSLCHQGLVGCDDGRYRLLAPPDFMEGTISVHPRGFGFALVTKAAEGAKPQRDLFVPAEGLGPARHGDRALLRVTGRDGDRLLARVVRVLARASNVMVGTYTAGGRNGLFTPEDDRYPFTIVVPRPLSLGARDGEAVVVEITDQPAAGHPQGRIIEVLGDPDTLSVQTEMVIRKFELPHRFGTEALAQAEALPGTIEVRDGRADLRQVLHVTIDGETARDFDDAVAVEKTRTGYRLHVSIADVSHYVDLGSPLDQEAYARGTSVYFPTRVLPMLPERLSNGLCSLVPNEDRYAFTAILDFDQSGKRLKKQFTRSVIRSHNRFTYTTVKEIIIDQEPAVRSGHQRFLTPLAQMEELARLLLARRMARGSIGFELPEAEVVIGPEDTVAGILRTERNFAHQIIEEFMLAANEAVAETFAEAEFPALYRVHAAPDPIKVAEFAEFAGSMGLELPGDPGTPSWFGKVLASVAGEPTEYIVNNLLLRTMNRAVYSPDNVGHFGLAAPFYTHFTSPIRRYPDLLVHRALTQLLAGKAGAKARTSPQPLPEAGLFLSERERTAVDADREMVDRLKARFMAGKIGEELEGVISGVSGFGLFVELFDLFVNGAIPIADLTDDFYHLSEKQHRYVGERTGRSYQLGDLVLVRVANVNLRRRRIDFELVEKLS
ncbi:MAG: ribonuclease R [Desulfobacteraceae bacterium]|nr:ribonuclease R [Desulfobacteraceae bacterium]